ncbi:25463_t:CDS:1, partial [Gigaspora margarita]
KIDYVEQRTSVLEQKAIYSILHREYKKALQKALQTKSKSRCLIEVLQEFTNEDNDELLSKDSQDDDLTSDNENSNANVSQQSELQNLKKKRGRGRPP